MNKKDRNAWEYLEGEISFKMLKTRESRKIEEFYEALKNVQTPYGTCYLARLKGTKRSTLIFGPNDEGTYYFFYFGLSGKKGYCGMAFAPDVIAEERTKPVISYQEMKALNGINHYDPYELQDAIFNVILKYADTGEVVELARPLSEGE